VNLFLYRVITFVQDHMDNLFGGFVLAVFVAFMIFVMWAMFHTTLR
jgi:hypothetical protein